MNNGTHRGLYAVIDLIADDIVGLITLHRHEAAATRMFTDALSMKDSMLAQHPQDFELHRLGYLDDEHDLVANRTIVATGKQWLNQRAEGAQPELFKENA